MYGKMIAGKKGKGRKGKKMGKRSHVRHSAKLRTPMR